MVYLLNGRGGNFTEWSTNSDVTAYSSQFQAIFVMPDGGTNATAGWYSDWADRTYQFERWHINAVLPYIDSHYRTARGHNAIAGLSMGGFGALSYSARHPGLFRATASFSGLVDNQYLTPVSGMDANMKRAWGDQVKNSSTWAAHNPTQLAANLKRTRLFLACGTGKPDQPKEQSGVEENYLFQQHAALLAQLQKAGVAHTDNFYAGGTHSWGYWQSDLHWALPQMMKAL
ncbi:MAG: hypothetical protein QOJ32_358 [Frankiaceae bacterium]|nr:hypothetical protein [Frankiaceae bacterium]